MSDLVWPDPQGLLDDLAEYFEEVGQSLVLTDRDGFTAGLNRAQLAAGYDKDATLFILAALMFDGVSTRHPLVDGNKRLAWQSAVTFMGLNDWYLDAPERASFEIGMAVIKRDRPVEDLAAFFQSYAIPMPA